ncbi:hypothetical protein [Mongoliimonas terrestris]|uniref:hypothetical protein n=1 Tax=Mongoliimonas terrestris TaxID=1709001 RepID=UPI00094956D2|nr:hypothetical protein [Mongoliimonas terrestris]
MKKLSLEVADDAFDLDLVEDRSRNRKNNARAISEALSRAARTARAKSMRMGGGGFSARQGNKIFRIFVAVTFAAIVLTPLAFAIPYFLFFASSQYVVESQLSIRSPEKGGFDILENLTGISGSASQEIEIVEEFIVSRAMVQIIDREIGMETLFSGEEIDALSRLEPGVPIEDVVRYWRHQVSVDRDSMSKILTVKVWAFDPQQAVAVSKIILAEAERVINELSDRSKHDAIAYAEADLKASQDRLRAVLDEVRTLRNDRGVLDPTATAGAISSVVGQLKSELTTLRRDFDTRKEYLSSDSPTMRYLSVSIESLEAQIGQLETQLTSSGGQAGSSVISEAMRSFDELALNQKIAQTDYQRSVVTYERARIDAEQKKFYLMSFIEPMLPDMALYPNRALAIFYAVLACLGAWGAVVGIGVLVRNHVAV